MNQSDEIKTWMTQSAKRQIAGMLILDKISFSYDAENGIIFSAPEWYVKKIIYRLISSYGREIKPVITKVTED